MRHSLRLSDHVNTPNKPLVGPLYSSSQDECTLSVRSCPFVLIAYFRYIWTHACGRRFEPFCRTTSLQLLTFLCSTYEIGLGSTYVMRAFWIEWVHQTYMTCWQWMFTDLLPWESFPRCSIRWFRQTTSKYGFPALSKIILQSCQAAVLRVCLAFNITGIKLALLCSCFKYHFSSSPSRLWVVSQHCAGMCSYFVSA